MKKIGLILGAFIILLLNVNAQSQSSNSSSYRTALGVKVWGDGGGISLKHFVSGNTALEGVGYFWRQGFRLTGLLEIHGPISGAPLKWYIGPGAHLGFYNTKYGDGTFIGIDGVLGLDFKCRTAPLNFSLDWQPSFEFGDTRGFVGSWGGLGIRYTF